MPSMEISSEALGNPSNVLPPPDADCAPGMSSAKFSASRLVYGKVAIILLLVVAPPSLDVVSGCPAAVDTSTLSVAAPTFSSTVRSNVRPVSTTTLFKTAVWNPLMAPVSWYVPDRRLTKTNDPSTPECVESVVFVAVSVNVSVTLGTTAPEESLTIPWIPVVVTCAVAKGTNAARSITNATVINLRNALCNMKTSMRLKRGFDAKPAGTTVCAVARQ